MSVVNVNAVPPLDSEIVNVVGLLTALTKYSSVIVIPPKPAPLKITDMPAQSESVVPQVIKLPVLDVEVQNTVIGLTVAVPVPAPTPVAVNVMPTELLIAPINT